MPIVDIQELEKKAKKKKEDTREIVTREIDGVTYFQGKIVEDWFDDYGQCLKANEVEARNAEYRSLGYNDQGQSPEQVQSLQATAKLIERREKLLAELKTIDVEIAQIRSGKVSEVKEVKKKK